MGSAARSDTRCPCRTRAHRRRRTRRSCECPARPRRDSGVRFRGPARDLTAGTAATAITNASSSAPRGILAPPGDTLSFMRIRRAAAGDADTLSDLAHRAKAHWGYPASWMREWDPQLTIIPGYLELHDVFVA